MKMDHSENVNEEENTTKNGVGLQYVAQMCPLKMYKIMSECSNRFGLN